MSPDYVEIDYVETGGLQVARPLYDLVKDEIAPGTGANPDSFWSSLGEIVTQLEPNNRKLLDKRDRLQKEIDAWHKARDGEPFGREEYKSFLYEIGYLVPEGPDFNVNTLNVDRELAEMAGPQLVVPLTIERFATNAANARWGSLYDALYGFDLISEDRGAGKRGDGPSGYNPRRGARVIAYSKKFLDDVVGLETGSHALVTRYKLDANKDLVAVIGDKEETHLADRSQFAGFNEAGGELTGVLLRNNGMHIEIQINGEDETAGRYDSAGVKGILLEAAVTTIQDLEDSVSSVDADDKAVAYGNWNKIMKGTLEAAFVKNGQEMVRELNPDRTYMSPKGGEITLPGRSLLLNRNVGIHLYTDAVLTEDKKSIPEGFLDAMVTSLAAVHDLKRSGEFVNSQTGSIYFVKPKLHGPEEVAATVELFGHVEKALDLDKNTIKIGIMDEERRTTVNLKECIRAAEDRIVFINTGFLDRTGDEIHTNMFAGAMLRKEEIKQQKWLTAYENWNVDIGIECGLPGRAQIGKGMWVMPDNMKAMYGAKIAHPLAGANTAWVPSPSAATIHAMHYHYVDVEERQKELAGRDRASLDDILTIPLLDRELTPQEIQTELKNNAQGILGYVSRWVGQGIGCSKVPDLEGTNLMEDLATLRISSQHIANWLEWDIVTEKQVGEIFREMASVVDGQNAHDENYSPMAENYAGDEFRAALEIVSNGLDLPNGYTESVLRAHRLAVKETRAD
ncbi:MAG: malate synthase G [Nitrospinota bacterium]